MRAYPRRPAGLAAAQYCTQHYRTPRALPGAAQQERTAQANRYASLARRGRRPRTACRRRRVRRPDGGCRAAARAQIASISNRISRRATKGFDETTKVCIRGILTRSFTRRQRPKQLSPRTDGLMGKVSGAAKPKRQYYDAEFKLRVVRDALRRPAGSRIKPTCRKWAGIEPVS